MQRHSYAKHRIDQDLRRALFLQASQASSWTHAATPRTPAKEIFWRQVLGEDSAPLGKKAGESALNPAFAFDCRAT